MESEAITVYLAFVLEELQLLKINICMCVAKCDWCVSISMYTRLCFTYENNIIKGFRAKSNIHFLGFEKKSHFSVSLNGRINCCKYSWCILIT